MMPRYELSAVPYALSLKPGVVINGSVNGSILDVTNTYGGSLLRDELGNGISASTSGKYSNAFYASTTGEDSTGVLTSTTGEGSMGVFAFSSGNDSFGVVASTHGDDSISVYAVTYGNDSEGFYAITLGDDSDGVHASTSGNYSDGVVARTDGNYSDGISADTYGNHSDGVSAKTYGDDSDGVIAITYGENSRGVQAYSAESDGIYSNTGRSDHRYGVCTDDYMYALRYEGGGGDVAEYFAVDEDVEPGTVMVIGEDSKLQSSITAYDTTVAGIVSTAPGVSLGANETGNAGEKLIAVAGRVPCKVDASYASVKPGDLLTTSDTRGHAMKATNPQIGTILGKALEPLDSGTGVIEVLVTLQ
jgi:hypothetical protein